MADEYRDYGALDGQTSPKVIVDTQRRTQVYQATHDGGDRRLPLMDRSFISFTFGGEHIEDFSVIATTSGDRMERQGYAEFEDTTSTYSNLDGQQYWSTHYHAHEFNFTLSTDGMTQKTLDEFLHWFQAGTTRELILAEHPNRAILARVAQPPQLSLLPFEDVVTFTLRGQEYKTKTTLYRGDIELTLVSDEPFWYSKRNLLGEYSKEDNGYVDKWINTNGVKEDIFASQDALKILLEDGIPIGSMLNASMLLGNGRYADLRVDEWSKVCTAVKGIDNPNPKNPSHWLGAHISGVYEGIEYHGIIAGAIIGRETNGISALKSGDAGYFFYAGTAPAFTEISFNMVPVMNDEGYIISPINSHSNIANKKYNTITIESRTAQHLKLTTPNLYTSYNKAIELCYQFNSTVTDVATGKQLLRDSIRHPSVRKYALQVAESKLSLNDAKVITSDQVSEMITEIKKFLNGNNGVPSEASFTFNSKTGKATGTFTYYIKGSNGQLTKTHSTEDVGDMLLSNYIIIRDRNAPTAEGRIEEWGPNNPTRSHRIIHDITTGNDNEGLTHLQVLYRHMYL